MTGVSKESNSVLPPQWHRWPVKQRPFKAGVMVDIVNQRRDRVVPAGKIVPQLGMTPLFRPGFCFPTILFHDADTINACTIAHVIMYKVLPWTPPYGGYRSNKVFWQLICGNHAPPGYIAGKFGFIRTKQQTSDF